MSIINHNISCLIAINEITGPADRFIIISISKVGLLNLDLDDKFFSERITEKDEELQDKDKEFRTLKLQEKVFITLYKLIQMLLN